MAKAIFCYILHSSKLHKFYYGHTHDIKKRTYYHNSGKVKFTSTGRPWRLVWFSGFITLKEAKNFEKYLKTGSGKAFAYKRLVSETLKKDLSKRN